jgi:hypothetical protein
MKDKSATFDLLRGAGVVVPELAKLFMGFADPRYSNIDSECPRRFGGDKCVTRSPDQLRDLYKKLLRMDRLREQLKVTTARLRFLQHVGSGRHDRDSSVD